MVTNETKYLITQQDGYSVKFYLIDENQKEVILKTKKFSNINTIPCFGQIKDVLHYLTKQNFILGKEEFVYFSSDVVLNT